MPTKPMVMENSAGEVYGNQAEPLGLPSVASHTEATPRSAAPRDQAQEAADHRTRVVQSFHSTLMNSTGKLAEAAMAKARTP
jgi:hypothetical protein